MSKGDAWQRGWNAGKLPITQYEDDKAGALEGDAQRAAGNVLGKANLKQPGLAKGDKVGRGFADLN